MGHQNKQTGFTIVELLIVVVVIAILAAITIVSYNGITSKAKSLVIVNSLKNAVSMMQYEAVAGVAPTTLPSTLKPDNDIVLHLAKSTSGPDDFCINAYRVSSFEVGSFDTTIGQTRPYLCPGILVGSPVGGSLPDVPISKNLIASDFENWRLTGGVTYDKVAKELVFSGASGNAYSPLVRMAGLSTSAGFTYELYSTTGSVKSSPQAGTYSGSAYFGIDGATLVMNSAGYTTNGNSQPVPLSAWTSRTWIISTGPNVQYVRLSINLSSADWTSSNFRVRNPSIERKG